MPTLKIQNFSCIKEAEIELKNITILIGPQASGKSIISKLFYFFNECISDIYSNAEEGNSLKSYYRNIEKKFSNWFPESAWGRGKFDINYAAGPVTFSAIKKVYRRGDVGKLTITASPFFESRYEDLLNGYRQVLTDHDDEDDAFMRRFATSYPVRRDSIRTFRSAQGNDHVLSQLFIPAGRSFFTNLNKAVAILEHGSQLDDITKSFGRYFTSLLNHRLRYYHDKPTQRMKEFKEFQKQTLGKIFGGEIKLSSNDMHVATEDGRKIPLSTLSSGQQELFPLVLFLQNFTEILFDADEQGINVLYVEEPEAHLFPEAQGALTQHLADIANFNRSACLLITTHSPYVLSTFNNLIKAYSVGSKKKNTERVSEIVRKSAWINPRRIKAYAIENNRLSDIQDDSGLIDATYLDSISSEIADIFSALQEIEYSND